MESSYYPYLLIIAAAMIAFLVWYMRSWMSSSRNERAPAPGGVFSRAKFDMESHVLEDGIFLLKATGHLVLTHTTRIRGAIREQIDQSRTKIVLDCSAVDHMDAPSIAELVSAYSQLRRAGGDMALVRGPGLKVMEDMALGKLDPFFHDSVEEAVEHLARISPQVS